MLQKNKRERIGRILQMHASKRRNNLCFYAGDIVAARVGLKDTTTGDSLCDPNAPIILESMEFPEPVIFVAIEPASKVARKRWCSSSEVIRRRSYIHSKN